MGTNLSTLRSAENEMFEKLPHPEYRAQGRGDRGSYTMRIPVSCIAVLGDEEAVPTCTWKEWCAEHKVTHRKSAQWLTYEAYDAIINPERDELEAISPAVAAWVLEEEQYKFVDHLRTFSSMFAIWEAGPEYVYPFLAALFEERLKRLPENFVPKDFTRCWGCKAIFGKRLHCVGCQCAVYCSKGCQEKDWSRHKKYCSRLIGMPGDRAQAGQCESRRSRSCFFFGATLKKTGNGHRCASLSSSRVSSLVKLEPLRSVGLADVVLTQGRGRVL